MVIRAHFDSHLKQLRFEDFPITPLNYREDDPQDNEGFVRFQTTDKETGKVLTVFVKGTKLQDAGISLTTWKKIQNDASEKLPKLIKSAFVIHCLFDKAISVASEHLSSKYLKVFTETTFVHRVIINAMYSQAKRLSGIGDAPGIYLSSEESSMNVFINLKKTPPLGKGGYGKIRKVLWLTAPQKSSILVAKKVFVDDDGPANSLHFNTEISALQTFHGKRGIISMISGGVYDNKYAIFLPLYRCDLHTYLFKCERVALDGELSMISQWLEGLAIISEEGIHGDLSPGNLLLKWEEKEMKSVICDFGTFRRYGNEEHGLTTPMFAPPEYFARRMVSDKQDVWAMGISLHEIFSEQWLPFWQFREKGTAFEKRMTGWTSTLAPGWVLNYPTHAKTPRFLLNLINEMLDPRPEHRPSAKEVFKRFSIGLSSFNRPRSELIAALNDLSL